MLYYYQRDARIRTRNKEKMKRDKNAFCLLVAALKEKWIRAVLRIRMTTLLLYIGNMTTNNLSELAKVDGNRYQLLVCKNCWLGKVWPGLSFVDWREQLLSVYEYNSWEIEFELGLANMNWTPTPTIYILKTFRTQPSRHNITSDPLKTKVYYEWIVMPI